MGEDPMKIQHHFCDIFAKEPLSKNNYLKKIKKPRQRDIFYTIIGPKSSGSKRIRNINVRQSGARGAVTTWAASDD